MNVKDDDNFHSLIFYFMLMFLGVILVLMPAICYLMNPTDDIKIINVSNTNLNITVYRNDIILGNYSVNANSFIIINNPNALFPDTRNYIVVTHDGNSIYNDNDDLIFFIE